MGAGTAARSSSTTAMNGDPEHGLELCRTAELHTMKGHAGFGMPPSISTQSLAARRPGRYT